MANSQIYIIDEQTKQLIPIKLYDNGDGTFTLNGSGDAAQASVLAIKAKTDLLAASVGTDTPKAAVTQDHFHNLDNEFGYAAAPSGTHFGDLESLTPFVPVSGNNTWGTALGLIGTADTPVRDGKFYFDIRRLFIITTSNATPTLVRIIWGTSVQTSAQAITAKQYSDTVVTKTSAAGFQVPQEAPNVRIPSGGQAWVQIWNATNSATISFLFSMHEYPSTSP